ncbi:hypothetical protein KIPB_007919, partial [Kipferlia bialata]|eukprot:g7919.t1
MGASRKPIGHKLDGVRHDLRRVRASMSEEDRKDKYSVCIAFMATAPDCNLAVALELTGCSRSHYYTRLKQKGASSGAKPSKMGRPSAMSEEEKESVDNYLLERTRAGQATQVSQIVQFCRQNNVDASRQTIHREAPKHGMKVKVRYYCKSRVLDPTELERWIADVKKDLVGVRACMIFNLDEVPGCGMRCKKATGEGLVSKHAQVSDGVMHVVGGDEKSGKKVTVLPCVNALGDACP